MIKLSDLLATLPPEWPEDPFPKIQAERRRDGRAVVVLDDDPTGTQTVHDVPVLTEWSVEALQAELAREQPCFYVLTNSRALPLPEAQALNREIGRNLIAASNRSGGRAFVLVSRSDSTLRGHYPDETDALLEALGPAAPSDGTLLIPAFMAGLRRSIGDVHYVGATQADGEWLTPAGETEFAQDKSFGYRASNLREWVIEKSAGRIRAEDIFSISLETIRVGGPDAVTAALLQRPRAAGRSVGVVNAASERDLAVAVLGILQAERAGRRYLFRSAASFVQLRAGLAPRPLLRPAELLAAEPVERRGGLIVIGSYVPKTSGQLAALLQLGIEHIEVQVPRLLADDERADEIARAYERVERGLREGRDVAISSSRALIAGQNAAENLAIGQRVSASLVQIVQRLDARPRYVLAKGGITSSDLATRALGVQRAIVLGQILPGVPVWQLGSETRFPGLPYIVFPGNVGGPSALADLVAQFAKA